MKAGTCLKISGLFISGLALTVSFQNCTQHEFGKVEDDSMSQSSEQPSESLPTPEPNGSKTPEQLACDDLRNNGNTGLRVIDLKTVAVDNVVADFTGVGYLIHSQRSDYLLKSLEISSQSTVVVCDVDVETLNILGGKFVVIDGDVGKVTGTTGQGLIYNGDAGLVTCSDCTVSEK